MPAPKQTKADLQRRVMELESQLASRAVDAIRRRDGKA